MNTNKINELNDDIWNNESIKAIELNIINNILECKSVMSVETSMSFAKHLKQQGITNNNYPLFLLFLEIENHWVIDSLIGENDPFLFLNSIYPNKFLIITVLRILTKNHPKVIYQKTLSVLLGFLEFIYNAPQDGYELSPINFTDVNNIGKYLNKDQKHNEPNNNCIISILNQLGSLEGQSEDPNMEQMARQANNITECFFNQKKKMEDIIPQSLLILAENSPKEIPPEYIYLS
jgi:hypothetical protein